MTSPPFSVEAARAALNAAEYSGDWGVGGASSSPYVETTQLAKAGREEGVRHGLNAWHATDIDDSEGMREHALAEARLIALAVNALPAACARIEELERRGPLWLQHAITKMHGLVNLTNPNDPVGIALTVSGLDRDPCAWDPDAVTVRAEKAEQLLGFSREGVTHWTKEAERYQAEVSRLRALLDEARAILAARPSTESLAERIRTAALEGK